ncbi:MAG: UDP-N-acetylglucosamine 2-epimerase [Anaerolineae bacterium]|nr:UDP-N-acetylglucosamine 2-epimerase [Anaerolineae bacterium]
MIHVFVGTKAQFIKMAPIMQELDRRGIDYNLIDAGQHAGLTGDLIQQLGLRAPDVFLRAHRTNIDTVSEAVGWTLRHLSMIAFGRERIRQQVFRGKEGICLIHGDTLTTLLSLLYAKRCGLQVAHVEAGLRTFHLFDPFPEEIIRLIAMRYSDLLFAPSKWAFENLRKMGYAAKSTDAGGNTVADIVRYAAERIRGDNRPSGPYIVVTIHRVETIYSRSRLAMIVALLEQIARDRRVIFVLHEPTRKQLSRFGLAARIEQNPAIDMRDLMPYLAFVDLMAGADFVITDGGSIQEETYYLNVPCLIMRSKTEHTEGLGENAYLAEFDRDHIDRFFDVLPELRRRSVDESLHPSRVIVDHLLPWV